MNGNLPESRSIVWEHYKFMIFFSSIVYYSYYQWSFPKLLSSCFLVLQFSYRLHLFSLVCVGHQSFAFFFFPILSLLLYLRRCRVGIRLLCRVGQIRNLSFSCKGPLFDHFSQHFILFVFSSIIFLNTPDSFVDLSQCPKNKYCFIRCYFFKFFLFQ